MPSHSVASSGYALFPGLACLPLLLPHRILFSLYGPDQIALPLSSTIQFPAGELTAPGSQILQSPCSVRAPIMVRGCDPARARARAMAPAHHALHSQCAPPAVLPRESCLLAPIAHSRWEESCALQRRRLWGSEFTQSQVLWCG